MTQYIEPSSITGLITAPASKSMTQRAIAAALLAEGTSTVFNPSYCNDSVAATGIITALGATTEPFPDRIRITGSGDLKESRLNCGESGLAIRMFSPVAALCSSEIIMDGAPSLGKRPMSMIEEALSQLGVSCTTNNGFLPISIQGPLTGGRCEIDGSISSQLLTGLLIALPLVPQDSYIKVNNLKSKPYIDMTIELLDSFGIRIDNSDYSMFHIGGNQKYNPLDYTVEGDWSGAAFLLVAGAINGAVTITGLRSDSKQSDKAIITALRKAGARIDTGDKEIIITKSPLKAFEFDATESPDLFPPLVTLAAFCEGITHIKGVSRLIHKESNRATALRDEFLKMNIPVDIEDDIMHITGGEPEGAIIDSHNDHRIAMAAAVTALRAKNGIMINNAQCVAKSYPEFFNDLRKGGVPVSEYEKP